MSNKALNTLVFTTVLAAMGLGIKNKAEACTLPTCNGGKVTDVRSVMNGKEPATHSVVVDGLLYTGIPDGSRPKSIKEVEQEIADCHKKYSGKEAEGCAYFGEVTLQSIYNAKEKDLEPPTRIITTGRAKREKNTCENN